MEGVKTFWLVNSIYKDVSEFHFTSPNISFVVYVRDEKPIFVLDNTCDEISPNNMLFIEPLPEDWGKKIPDTKWDSILQNKFNIDSIKIRPKENTKYKKLDINYINLDIFANFIKTQSGDLLQKIIYNREDLSLENAYSREGESLIQYNKSTQTIKTATSAVDLLKTRILNVSKRLNRIEVQEQEHPEETDLELKQRVTQKLYDNTEKLKRAERRLKRATKRAEIAFNDLSLKRYQIQEIKNRISNRSVQSDVIEDSSIPSDNPTIVDTNTTETSQYIPEYTVEEVSQNQDVAPIETVELTNENLSAKNNQGEGFEATNSLKEEAIMAKETENKNVNQTTEFQPPYEDETRNSQNDRDIRFAKKTESFNDKYRKAWLYAGSIILSLVVIFGLFFFLGSSDSPKNNTSNFVEQNYEEQDTVSNETSKQVDDAVADDEDGDDEYFEEDVAVTEEKLPEYPMPEYKSVPAPTPVVVKKTVPVKAKPVSKKVPAKPVAKKTTPVKSVPVSKPVSLPKDEVLDDKEDDMDDSYYENSDKEDEEVADDTVSPLDIARSKFVSNVLSSDKYIEVIDYLRDNFFALDDNSKLVELEGMIELWNAFRNASYEAYYETDYTLKPDVNYEEYANDEYLLRLFTNKYYNFFEDVVNEFVMKYEYANSTAVDLYENIEKELEILGHPLAKLSLLARIYNSIQTLGGPDKVLALIEQKDSEPEDVNVSEIEAELLPLPAADEQTYTYTKQETTYYPDDTTVSTVVEYQTADSDVIESFQDENNYEATEVVSDEPKEESSSLVDDEDIETVVPAPVDVVEEEKVSEETPATDTDTEDEELLIENADASDMDEDEENNDIVEEDNVPSMEEEEEEISASSADNNENDDYFEDEEETDDSEYSDSDAEDEEVEV